MADSDEVASEGRSKGPMDFFSFLGKLIKFPLPKDVPKSEKLTVGTGENEDAGQKPDVVRFPYRSLEVPLPLKLEVEEESGRTSNPLILWQVYALGGFLIMKWVWGRWNERNRQQDNDEASDNYDSPAEDYGSPR
ncbi:hypothetical protein SAY87_019304 [Trapa incisa]|uniref:Uncharacterized protein n=1 Tax=Trapa incisa TaxID=236973 RepID=A0AAN7K5I8_9MYRT|nr:hypothetical protein SAY87_019304 [Trapa incisa]